MTRWILAATALLTTSGCMVERTYAGGGDDVGFETIAAVRGSAGAITDFDRSFTDRGTTTMDPFSTGAGTAYVEKFDDQVMADFVVEDARGNVYVTVQIMNASRMEIGEPVAVQFDPTGETAVDAPPTDTDEPTITVYACPDGPTDASGNAEELTVVLEEVDPRGGQRFSFTADAPNERQQLGMDGFLVAREGETYSQY